MVFPPLRMVSLHDSPGARGLQVDVLLAAKGLLIHSEECTTAMTSSPRLKAGDSSLARCRTRCPTCQSSAAAFEPGVLAIEACRIGGPDDARSGSSTIPFAERGVPDTQALEHDRSVAIAPSRRDLVQEGERRMAPSLRRPGSLPHGIATDHSLHTAWPLRNGGGKWRGHQHRAKAVPKSRMRRCAARVRDDAHVNR